MPFEKDPKELGALWIRTSRAGNEFLSGTINGVDVICFKNGRKTGKQPDYRVMKSEPRDGDASREPYNANAKPNNDDGMPF